MTQHVQTDTFLNPAEMQDLTGYKAASKQCQQLRSQGIPFFVNARAALKKPPQPNPRKHGNQKYRQHEKILAKNKRNS